MTKYPAAESAASRPAGRRSAFNVRRVEKISPQDGRPLYLAPWDFAGQHMEYATHQFFLKSGGIHLILWKARLGSDYGPRDLWYWLELLKMRVKDPEFLLVTTRTGKTPAALDLREVQALYPGSKGHFEVELCDGTGFTALEDKILDLAATSPSMRAVWPEPWLSVRDAIRGMRTETPYISADTFWSLCEEHEVPEAQQRDLADQLDKIRGGRLLRRRSPFQVRDPGSDVGHRTSS